MTFHSILYPDSNTAPLEAAEEPEYFHDLNLDQIVAAVTRGWEPYNLVPYFRRPLDDPIAIAYRQAILLDLDVGGALAPVSRFAEEMRLARLRLPRPGERYYRYEEERLFLNAARTYCHADRALRDALSGISLASDGMRAFAEYLGRYVDSEAFRDLVRDTESVHEALRSVIYSLVVREGSVTVRRYGGEPDYSVEVEAIFARFRQRDAQDYRVSMPESPRLNHVEAGILERVALLFPDVFRALVEYRARRAEFLDPTIARFDREAQFYAAWLSHIARLRASGLEFCIPRVSAESREVAARNAFDLALAATLLERKQTVVPNDFELRGAERLLVVTGPNHGGKTTFARMFGQMHHLARLGLSVPGTEARLFLCDRIFTHFEQQESIETLRGKLQDDLVRMHSTLARATERSILIINEPFSSTTLKDALFLGTELLRRLCALDLTGVCVTFLDELSTLNDKTVSMVSGVDPANPAVRTFRIERRPADGLAYALSVAERHRVTYRWLLDRIPA